MTLILLALACGGGNDDTDPSTEPNPTTDDGGGDPEETTSPDRPVLSDCSAECELHTTGDQFYLWTVGCTATDPQGPETLSPLGDLSVRKGGSEIASGSIACSPTGDCGTSFDEDQLGASVLCSDASSTTFHFTVYDLDGHFGTAEITGG